MGRRTRSIGWAPQPADLPSSPPPCEFSSRFSVKLVSGYSEAAQLGGRGPGLSTSRPLCSARHETARLALWLVGVLRLEQSRAGVHAHRRREGHAGVDRRALLWANSVRKAA